MNMDMDHLFTFLEQWQQWLKMGCWCQHQLNMLIKLANQLVGSSKDRKGHFETTISKNMHIAKTARYNINNRYNVLLNQPLGPTWKAVACRCALRDLHTLEKKTRVSHDNPSWLFRLHAAGEFYLKIYTVW